jgi:hypothetical protein
MIKLYVTVHVVSKFQEGVKSRAKDATNLKRERFMGSSVGVGRGVATV